MKTIALIDPPHDLKKYEEWKSQWADSDSVSFTNYIGECCHPEDFLIYSQFLIPTFIEVEDCVIIQERYQPDNFLAWNERFPGEYRKIEKALNNIDMNDLFLYTGSGASNIILEQVCNVMKISWGVTLKTVFPHKEFVIQVHSSTQDVGPSITFHQK